MIYTGETYTYTCWVEDHEVVSPSPHWYSCTIHDVAWADMTVYYPMTDRSFNPVFAATASSPA